ncbi:uncharacterized protein K444DRAFT_89285 [Hyaloscypha bicolor E]|uniref:Uncharacterized protein n=1 Tax=Hyaloscypha bicolor E TaxID=1095630 RepID=A0A2J6SXG6_9HELO|nr:uncharacterized protein K444DRAFT_89285 [Hyaloscypha bicolor E]PMD55477.1 hypothetical protein K444DRAFT_89285 [Hyaloscypha bicolor E]
MVGLSSCAYVLGKRVEASWLHSDITNNNLHSMPAFRNCRFKFRITVSRTGRQPGRLNPPSHRRCICIISNRSAKHNTIQHARCCASRTLDELTSLHLTLCHRQLTSPTPTTPIPYSSHDNDIPLPTQRSPPPSFPSSSSPPRDNLNLNLHALSLGTRR